MMTTPNEPIDAEQEIAAAAKADLQRAIEVWVDEGGPAPVDVDVTDL